MAERVYLHVGLPKTGTTYLQSVLWANRRALRDQGLTLPGRSRRQHMWASVVVREHHRLELSSERVQTSWEELVADVDRAEGTALISHEFFGGATPEQAGAALAAFAEGTEAHVVLTARDVLTIVTSYWQEYVKHGFDVPLDEFPPTDPDVVNEWSWPTIDLEAVLSSWGAHLPPERVHVLVLPPAGSPPERLLSDFTGLLGVDPTGFVTERARENGSLGLAEAELMRQVSPQLEGFGLALDRGVWLRGYLAHGKLVPRGTERFLPSEARVVELRERAEKGVAYVEGAGFDVVGGTGELQRLLVPDPLPARRRPQDVADREMLEAATATIAAMMNDLRTFRRQNTELKRAAVVPPPPPVRATPPPPRRRPLVRGRIRLRERLGILPRPDRAP